MSEQGHYVNTGGRWCADCGYVIGDDTWNSKCEPESPCYCCLAAEVEAARKLAANLTAENEALRAQLQRVRRLCAQHDLLRAAEVWDALDGGSNE